jgi:hypothetical protein
LCVLIALLWRLGPREKSLVLGDMVSGSMVLPASPAVPKRLGQAAGKVAVPMDGMIAASSQLRRRSFDRNILNSTDNLSRSIVSVLLHIRKSLYLLSSLLASYKKSDATLKLT